MSTSLNKKYVQWLVKYPLLTKSLTGGTLAILNELIASIIARDFKVISILNTKVKHPFSLKVPLLALFASLVSAPVNHYGLNIVNLLFKPPLTLKKRLGQILTVLLTSAPLLSTLFVSYVSLLNLKPGLQSLSKDELKRAINHVKISLKASLFSVIKSSWITTPIVLTICQTYLDPQYWVVFSNVIYFILATGQNTFLKLNTRKAQEIKKKQDDLKDYLESSTDEKYSSLIPGGEEIAN